MLLTITTTHHPATDLGYLLHKHPARVQQTEIRNGKAWIFYPEVSEARCTCALLLDMDPVGLVRNNEGPTGEAFALEQYVNDRPYVASSFMSTAIVRSFSAAMNGKCKDKPELVNVPLPLEVALAVLSVRGGRELLENLFLPLGYAISAEQHPLDEQFPNWGASRYFTVTLKHTLTIQALLSHLFVLIPVMDNDKHYWVNEAEVQKLLDKGKGWLEEHPQKDLIVRRYLRNLPALMDRFTKDDVPTEAEEAPAKIKLHDHRLQTVLEVLLATGAEKVADLGCGEGKLLKLLLAQSQFTQLTGMDVSTRSLEIAARRLKTDKLPEHQRQRIKLIQGAVTYCDERLQGHDAAALVEVIEHLEEDRLEALEKSVFAYMQPATVVITTPNKEWNVLFTTDDTMMRHSDHRFEWTRKPFANGANTYILPIIIPMK